jgi:hypothetical protein
MMAIVKKSPKVAALKRAAAMKRAELRMRAGKVKHMMKRPKPRIASN